MPGISLMIWSTAPPRRRFLLGEANGVQLTGNVVTVHDRSADQSAGHVVGGGGFVAGLVGKDLFVLSDAHHHFAEQNVVIALMVLVIVYPGHRHGGDRRKYCQF